MRMVEHASRDIYLTYLLTVYRQFYCDTNKQHSGSVDRMDQLAASAGSDRRDRAPGGQPHVGCARLVINNHYSLRSHRFLAVHQPDPCRERIFHTVGAAGWQYLSSGSSLCTYMNAGAPAKWGLAPKWRPWPTAASTWRQ